VTEYTFHYAVEATHIGDGEGRNLISLRRAARSTLCNVDRSFYATDDGCTHELSSLADGLVNGATSECPLHGGKFDIKTGRAIAPPCTVDLQTYPVKRDSTQVLVGLPIG